MFKKLMLFSLSIFLACFSAQAQNMTVTGKVTDSNGEALMGAGVIVSGTRNGTMTDIDGNFSLAVDKLPVNLEVSFIGCKTETHTADGNPKLIVLQSDNILDEVMVVGYGVQKKVNLTGAVSQITSEDMVDRPINKMTQALQGQIPNLNISFSSGKPGTSGTLNIRGTTSINGGSPLVLIDGIPGDLDRVNISDVESISVLKDASASAVYGARAAFGVILVTTKNASEGSVNVNYQCNFGWSTHATSTDFITTGYDNARINDTAFYNNKGTHLFTYTDSQWNELYIRRNDKVENPDRPWVTVENVNGRDRYAYYANFDWFNYLYSKARPRMNHDISISGKANKVSYLLSGSYSDETGIFRIAPDKERRYTVMSKIGVDLTKWLSISNTTRYFQSSYAWTGFNQSYTPSGADTIGSNDAQFYSPYYHYHAQYVPFNPDGTLTGNSEKSNYTMGFGMHAIQENGKSKGKENRSEFQNTVQATFHIIDGLNLIANYTYKQENFNRYYRSVPVQYSLYVGEMANWNWDALSRNQLTERTSRTNSHIVNVYANFDRNFGKHHVGVMAGYNQENVYYKSLLSWNTALLSDSLNDMSLATGTASVVGNQWEYALMGVFGRLNYDYAGRYLVELSGRYDGSSRFPKNSRFAFFPSLSVGYRISEEPFMKGAKKYLDNLKIRYSYGSLGNQDVSYYAYIPSMSVGNSGWLNSSGNVEKQTQAPSPVADNLTWEVATSHNIGLDIDMFGNRLNFCADLYQRETTGMLTTGAQLPNVFGAAEPKENAADLRTRGFELSLGWRDSFRIGSHNFSYSVKGILSDYQAEITRFDNPTGLLSQYRVGQKIGEIWGYKYDGFFMTDEEAAEYTSRINVTSVMQRSVPGYYAGDIKILDLDGNKVINAGANTVDNPGDRCLLGNSTPRYSYGLTLSASYFGFDIYVFFQGIGKRDWYPGGEAEMFWGPYSRPYASFIPSDFESKVWTPDNTNAYFPRLQGYLALGGEMTQVNSMYLQNAAYCKLRNLTIGYTVDPKLTRRIGISNIRVFVSGENICTWSALDTKYIDPEETLSGDARTYPMSRSWSIGASISF